MEQTFEEQCREDSRLAKKLLFVCQNFRFLCPIRHKDKFDVQPQEAPTPKPKPKPQIKPTKSNDVLFINLKCVWCSKDFKRLKQNYKTKKPAYCSQVCKNRASLQRKSTVINCYFCKEPFTISLNHLRHAKQPDRICCSNRCGQRARPKRAKEDKLSCLFCGKEFARKRSIQRGRPPYCSQSCSAKRKHRDTKLAMEALGTLVARHSTDPN